MRSSKLLRLLAGLALHLCLTISPVLANDLSADPVAPKKSAEAAEKDPNEPTVLDETIVVTATRGERAAESLPVSTSVMEREEIERAPALTPDDVLRSIPGLILPQLNSRQQIPSRNTVSMRGIGESSVLVLIDGIPANDALRESPQRLRLGTDAIDRVQVVRGAHASHLGTYCIVATMNLIT